MLLSSVSVHIKEDSKISEGLSDRNLHSILSNYFSQNI